MREELQEFLKTRVWHVEELRVLLKIAEQLWINEAIEGALRLEE